MSGPRITVLPCSFSCETLKKVLSATQKVLSEELGVLVHTEVLSVNATMKTQVVPILTVRAPSKSCHNDSQWQARGKRHVLFTHSGIYTSGTSRYQLFLSMTCTALHDLAGVCFCSFLCTRCSPHRKLSLILLLGHFMTPCLSSYIILQWFAMSRSNQSPWGNLISSSKQNLTLKHLPCPALFTLLWMLSSVLPLEHLHVTVLGFISILLILPKLIFVFPLPNSFCDT